MISLQDIEAARDVIAGRLHRTPVMGSTYIGELLGIKLIFKLEMFQKTGSFKPRGVLNNMHHLADEEKARGVISLSAGNHAQALAYAATASGIASTIVMPASAVRSKVEATRAYGGEVVLTDGNLMETTLAIQRSLVHSRSRLDSVTGPPLLDERGACRPSSSARVTDNSHRRGTRGLRANLAGSCSKRRERPGGPLQHDRR